jgi:hypothetical protein
MMACQETTEAHLECEEPTSADMEACQKTTACHEATETDTVRTEPDSGMMQPAAEHQEVPEENAIVTLVKEQRKRHRGRK